MGLAVIVDSDELKSLLSEMLQIKRMLAQLIENPKVQPTDEQKLISIPKAAKKIGMNEKTLRNEVEAGNIYAKPIGGQLRISPDELDRYVNSRPPIRLGGKVKHQKFIKSVHQQTAS